GAFCMAQFGPNEPYFIERDLVTPPLELQRLVFPWIEENFDKDMPERADSWREECTKEMLGVDPNVPTDEDIFWTPIEKKTSSKRLTRAFSTDSLVTRIGFLKLLVRMRRVILQDAVLFLKPNDKGKMLENKLLESLPEIFGCQLFLDFQHQLLRAIDVHRRQAGIIQADVPVNAQTM
ncbi:hypothetical protein BX616_009130, partial [Lobosporangium transversale]